MISKSLFAVVVLMLSASCALAQDNWVITRPDFSRQSVTLRTIDAQGAKVLLADDGQETALSLDQILELDHSAVNPAAAPFVLQLLNGDCLAGEPTGIAGDNITWKSDPLGELSIPLKQARALVAAGASASGETRTEDWVFLKNADKVTGTVTALANGTLTVSVNGSPVSVPLASVAAVEFAKLEKPADSTERAFRVKLVDGSILTASAIQFPAPSSAHAFQLSLPSGDKTLDINDIAGIEQLNGPVSWLSTRTPSENVQVPMLGRVWPAQMDLSVDGTPLQAGDQSFARGIGVHSYSKLVFPLDGSYKAFRTQFAIDGNREKANCTARIKLDDKVVYEQKDVVAGKLWPVVNLDLGDAKTLTLEVDYGPTSWVQGHFDWIEPALLKSAPPASQP